MGKKKNQPSNKTLKPQKVQSNRQASYETGKLSLPSVCLSCWWGKCAFMFVKRTSNLRN